ncbi:MAG TPA: acyltransferase family protein [Rhizomicrobium sp.]|nr:acyltransferase family protein [Rhizomicrobium sp.]
MAISGVRPAHYRADIDGLRALAVLSVILFHYHVAPFSGGFVGVDIFFVISGFLITSLIHDEIAERKFSIARFYERRVRRIFPALFFVLAVSAIAAGILFFPYDLQHFGSSLEATIVFGSNFLFNATAGYWDTVAQRKPLLHTWSLAVEEQYYLLFPAILFFAAKGGEKLQRIAIALILALSLALSIWGVRAAPTSAFYLLPYRAWELMLGGMIAIGGVPAPKARWLREVLCLLGLALILFSIFAYSSETRFPGEAAIAPCLGAALLIFAGEGGSAISAGLASPPFRAIGLISYSLYLWHWVILVFSKYALFRELDAVETVEMIVLSFAMAAISWRFIELPFRDRNNFSRRSIFLMALAASLVGIGVGAVFASNGLPQRYPPRIQRIIAVQSDLSYPKGDGCLDRRDRFSADSTLCRFGDPAAPPSFALWGDSHAGMVLPVIAEAAIAKHRAGIYAEKSSCPPLLGVNSSRARGCRAFDESIVARILSDPKIRDVILTADWAKSVTGTPYRNDDSGDVFLSDDQSANGISLAQNKIIFERGLDRLVQSLKGAGRHVEIIASTPEIGWPVPETLARIELRGSNVDIRPTLGDFLERQKPVFHIFDDMRQRYGVTIVYPHLRLCVGGRCMVAMGGEPIYLDSHHITYRGVELLRPTIEPLLDTGH